MAVGETGGERGRVDVTSGILSKGTSERGEGVLTMFVGTDVTTGGRCTGGARGGGLVAGEARGLASSSCVGARDKLREDVARMARGDATVAGVRGVAGLPDRGEEGASKDAARGSPMLDVRLWAIPGRTAEAGVCGTGTETGGEGYEHCVSASAMPQETSIVAYHNIPSAVQLS
jgi:hypothetical protein